ncbi:MAG: 4Fe-4S cluster-binding domain-containing protein [Nitrospiraceae bacterium]|nr:4Fe-4S cluster-binding domain-containing protein [Nitrospiraceae bacterium]
MDYCNISCMDCNHAASAAGSSKADPDSIFDALSILSKYYRSHALKIVGGEPLLHPDLLLLIRAVRKSNICKHLALVTNGIFLNRMSDDIWRELDEVELSIYPETKSILKKYLPDIKQSAVKHKVKLVISPYKKFRITFSTIGTTNAELIRLIYKNCRLANLWGCQSIHEGYFFKCPQCIYIPRILDSKAGYDYKRDGVRITDSPNILRDLSEYLSSQEPLRACRYCLGSSGKHRDHKMVKTSEFKYIHARPTEELVDYQRFLRK